MQTGLIDRHQYGVYRPSNAKKQQGKLHLVKDPNSKLVSRSCPALLPVPVPSVSQQVSAAALETAA
jgi:hypothetical protein